MNQRALEAGARADALFDGRTWQAMPKSERQRYIERSRAHHAHLKAEGFVVVPASPNYDMGEAGIGAFASFHDEHPAACVDEIYRAMLSAATTGESDASD